MMIFCPICANMLVLQISEDDEDDKNVFGCMSCPYIYPINSLLTDRQENHELKRVEDIFTEKWDNLPKSRINCPNPKCNNNEASFTQQQTRSADEPMTIFYKCTKCGHRWNEG